VVHHQRFVRCGGVDCRIPTRVRSYGFSRFPYTPMDLGINMQLVLCGATWWDDLPERDTTTFLAYCNVVWHDTKVIHICADYVEHAAVHECGCGETE
jgi:hypothetical protein